VHVFQGGNPKAFFKQPKFYVNGTFAEAMWDSYRPKADEIAKATQAKGKN